MSAPRKATKPRARADRPDHSSYLEPFNARRLGRLRRELLRWYAATARPLPWRGTRDPYAIWISEIMLQQTTVAAVQPYFRRFLDAFPNVATLADADETSVLKLWQGLGYYSRARNLRAAARRVVDEFNGRFPETVDELRSLPGIGRYTAGAIVSFAYDRPAPIVEANTLRLYARLMGFAEDPRATAGMDLLWAFAERILPSEEAGTFNQALMELGSQVCRPTPPDCPACPLKTVCRAFEEGRQAEIPLAKKATVFEDVVEHAVVVRRRDDAYLLMRWQPGERWAGLWDFVRFGGDRLGAAVAKTARGPDRDMLARAVREVAGVTVRVGESFHEIKHGVTRFRIRLVCHSAEHVSGEAGRETASSRGSPRGNSPTTRSRPARGKSRKWCAAASKGCSRRNGRGVRKKGNRPDQADPDGCEAFDLRTAIGFPPISEFLLAANRFRGRVPFLNLAVGNAHDRLRRCKLSGGEVRRPTDSAEVVDTLRRQFLPRHLVRDVPRRRLGRADIEAAGRIMRDDFLQHGVLRPRVETHQFVSHVGAGLGQTVLQAEDLYWSCTLSSGGIEKNPAPPPPP